MYEQIVMAALPVGPIGIVVAGLVLAAVIAGGAIFLLRGNKKKASDANAANSASNWQPQMQAQGQGQGQGGAQPWGQPGMGGQGDAWAQQAGGWGQPQQGQPANPWGAQQGQGQQAQQANPWGAQQAGGWGADAQVQQANSWGAQPGQQGQAAGWGTGVPQQQAGGWDNAAQQAGGWGQPAQGQSATPWDANAMAAPQDPWGQAAGQQQGWGQPQQVQPAQTAYGAGSNPSWNQPSFPGAQPAPADAWGGAAAGQYQGQGVAGAAASPAAAAWQQPQQQSYGDGDKTMLRAPGSATGIGMVRVEEGKEPGKVYEIRKDSLSIGRSRESDIFLEDLAVSRFHASILNLGNGNYALKDEGSANGTKVNGQLVNKYQTYPLQEGDHIQLGQTVLVFGRR